MYLSCHVFTDKDTDNGRHHYIMVIVLSLIKCINSSHDYPLAMTLKSAPKNAQEKRKRNYGQNNWDTTFWEFLHSCDQVTCMKQSLWEATSCKATPQNSPFLHETWKAQHHAHSVPPFPVWNYINPFHILTHCFFKISFRIILLHKLCLFPSGFPSKSVCTFLTSVTYCMLYPSQPSSRSWNQNCDIYRQKLSLS